MIKAWNSLQTKHKWAIGICLIATLIARLMLFNVISNDYFVFLSPWYDYIKNNGGLKSLPTLKADYNLPYQYAMVIMTMLPVYKLWAIKIFSVVFDYVLAYYIFRITQKMMKDDKRAFAGAILGLMLPTILANSAGWGQSDSIFTAMLVASVFYVIDEKPTLAMLFYSISFGFKIQAIFLGPLMLILLVKKFFSWRHLLVPVGYYILLTIPILFVGGSFTRILDIAVMQINIREGFSFFLPNFYYLFNADSLLSYAQYKTLFLGLFAVIIIAAMFLCYKDMNLKDKRSILVWAFVFSAIVPFFLIRMHERYYFPAEYFALALTMIDSQKYKLMLFDLVFTSFVGYITVQWWLTHGFNIPFAVYMTLFVYPFLSATLALVFVRSVFKEYIQRKSCNTELIK